MRVPRIPKPGEPRERSCGATLQYGTTELHGATVPALRIVSRAIDAAARAAIDSDEQAEAGPAPSAPPGE